jgi:PelA/Pel-15E family pectate lyase
MTPTVISLVRLSWVAAAAFLVLMAEATMVCGQEAASARRERRGVRWSQVLSQDDDWYAGDEAVRIADNVLVYQHANGGWPKNIDMARPLDAGAKERIAAGRDRAETLFDNGATHTQIRYLARVHAATGEPRFAEGCRRGLQFVLAAQYENGGWPMIYPLQRNYTAHITFNDGAMIGVMTLLRDAARGEEPFAFLEAPLRERAAQAIEKGLDAVLRCQIVVDGQPTAWCAQHDEHDFKPAKARSYELPSLSGQESVGVVEYLMAIDEPSPEVRRAIRAAVAWFEAAKIEGLRIRRIRAPAQDPPFDLVVEEDADAEPLWARFYEIGANRPMFVGRDGVVHERLADIEHERRTNYAYLGPWARGLLQRDYPRWKEKWGEQ